MTDFLSFWHCTARLRTVYYYSCPITYCPYYNTRYIPLAAAMKCCLVKYQQIRVMYEKTGATWDSSCGLNVQH